jgi:nucleoside-diphosphate-sugar epimerase
LAARPDLASVVVRLPMVFGPGDRQRRFAWATRPMLAKAPAIELDAAWAAWRTTYGFVEDVAAGLELVATSPDAAGAYNLGYEDAPDHLGWAARFAARLGWTGEIRRAPRDAAAPQVRAALDALDLSAPFITDTARIRRELGYREAVGLDEALDRTIDDEARRAGV